MGPDVQLDENGEMITEEQKSIVWHEAFLIEKIGNIHLHEVIPKLRTPLDASVLTRYIYTGYTYKQMIVNICKFIGWWTSCKMCFNTTSILRFKSPLAYSLHFTIAKWCPVALAVLS